jgi:hypothetical protein
MQRSGKISVRWQDRQRSAGTARIYGILKRTRLADFDARRSFKAAALLYPSRARRVKQVPPDDGVEKLPADISGSSSRIILVRVSALFLARARRSPSQRVPDNIVESTNNQVRAATDQTVTLFIAPSFPKSASVGATGGHNYCNIKSFCQNQTRRRYYFTSIRHFIGSSIIASGCCKSASQGLR